MMHKMNILVITPMESERDNFKRALDDIQHRNIYRLACSGLGKANAASITALELFGNTSAPQYDLIAVIGYAGGSNRLKQGDFVIPKMARYHDVECPEDLVPELSKVYELQGNDNVIVLTGDSFVTENNVKQISEKNTTCEAILYDMETAAVCQIADQADIPVVVLKLVSDNPAKSDNLQSFDEFVKTHSNFSQFVHYLESL